MMLDTFQTKFKSTTYLNSHFIHRYNIILKKTKSYIDFWNLLKELYQIKDKEQFDRLDKYFTKLEYDYKHRHKRQIK